MSLLERLRAAKDDAIRITVYGTPQTAGSKRAYKRGNHINVVDDNPNSRAWKKQVAQYAGEVMAGAKLLDGPLELELRFYRSRPKGHLSKRTDVELVPSAPAFPITRPDTTKLIRAVEDALTGIVWRDDAQVVDQHAFKRYGAPERAEIVVRPLHREAGR